MKISHGNDRDKRNIIKRERRKPGRERKRAHVFGEVLDSFEEDTGAAPSQQTSKALH